MKRTLIFLFVTLIFVWSCVSQKEEKVKLNYLFWGDTIEIQMNHHWIEEFKKKNPGVEVNEIVAGGEGYQGKLLTMFASGVPVDVFYIRPGIFYDLAEKNVLYPLNEYMKQDGIESSLWFETLIEPYTYKGKIYGLPRSWHPFVVYYNKEIFDKFGVPYPDYSWTWNDLIKYGKKICVDRNNDNKPDIFAIGGIEEVWDLVIWSFGGEYISKDGKRGYFNTPRVKKALRFLKDLIYRYRIAPTPSELCQGGTDKQLNARNLFMMGKIAMYIIGLWVVPEFRKASFQWDIAPIFEGKRRVTKLVTAGWAIGRNSKHKEIAWKLVKYLSGKEAQLYQTKLGRDPSGLKSVFKQYLFLAPDKPPFNRTVIENSIKFGRFENYFPHYEEIKNSVISHYLELIFIRKDSNVDKICKEIDSQIEKYWKEKK